MVYYDLDEIGNDSLNIGIIPGSGKPWKQQYYINNEQFKDITGWIIGPSLPEPLANSQAIVTKNRVYLLGGYNGSSTISTVYTASINSDGTLSAWATAFSLPEPLRSSQAIVTQNRVYLLGGYNGDSVSTVYSAGINSDGTLRTWTTAPSLPGPLSHSQAIVTRNRVYLLGGHNGSSAVSVVYSAFINSDGTLSAWTTGASLPGALCGSQAVITRNRVYLLGGWNSNGYLSTIYTAPINSDGALGAWTTAFSLPGPLAHSQAIVTRNRVYLLGGWNGNAMSTVYVASINSDGVLSAWTSAPSLPRPLAYSQAIVTRNRVHLLGGWGGSYISTVYTASIFGGLDDYSLYYKY